MEFSFCLKNIATSPLYLETLPGMILNHPLACAFWYQTLLALLFPMLLKMLSFTVSPKQATDSSFTVPWLFSHQHEEPSVLLGIKFLFFHFKSNSQALSFRTLLIFFLHTLWGPIHHLCHTYKFHLMTYYNLLLLVSYLQVVVEIICDAFCKSSLNWKLLSRIIKSVFLK